MNPNIKNRVFFRNDDVNVFDELLKRVTEIFIQNKIPISHAVEPANIKEETVKWLLAVKSEYPDLVEIIQHGYTHKKNEKSKGEFGGKRSFKEQYDDIKAGKNIMDDLFGTNWLNAFSFPFGIYNIHTIKALDLLNYKIISTGFRYSKKRIVLNYLGQKTGKKFILNKPVIFFNELVPKTKFLELPVIINLTKRIINHDNAIQKTSGELNNDVELIFPRFNIVGFLIHHRWWTEKDLKTLDTFLKFLKSQPVIFQKMESFINV